MNTSVFVWIIVGVFVLDTIVLFIYSLNLVILMILSKINKQAVIAQKNRLREFPFITIQIPLFNEKYVVQRIIDAAVCIDYPKDRMEIQILDDSTDETLSLSEEIVASYKEKGFGINLLHRKIRTGFKGGALREGLKTAKGEYIVIFDADFVPEKEILQALIPLFRKNPKLGMIQTRWGHLNPDYSPLTKAQSILIDSHFIIEQAARSAHNLFFNFNGTAGIWRKQCILDAGNWQDDTLTEDSDLSFRAALKDWEFKYINNIVNKAELPILLSAYKSQQFRWAKGSIQVIKKLYSGICHSTASLFKKIEALIHLSYYSVHPLLLLNILLLNPLLIFKEISDAFQTFFGTGALLLSFASFIPFILFINVILSIGKNWKQRVSWIPFSILFGTGLAVNNSIAVIQAFGGQQSEFVRTPKVGAFYKKGKWNNAHYIRKSKFQWHSLIELFFCVYSGSGIIFASIGEKYFIIPFLLIYSLAFGSVFFLGLKQYRQTNRSPVTQQ